MSEQSKRATVWPLLACRPVNLADMTPDQQRVWNAVKEETGLEPSVYPGSIRMPCEVCRIPVWVGPKAQELMEQGVEQGVDVPVHCMFCAVERMAREENAGHSVGVANLGNTYQPQKAAEKGGQ